MDSQLDQAKVQSERLDGERAKRESYTKMNAAKEYLTYVWREVMSGNTDYESITPEVVIAKQNS